MKNSAVSSLLLLTGAAAFPFVADLPGVDSSAIQAERTRIRRQQPKPYGPGSAATCPFNPDHRPAAPFDPQYPYNHARDGRPGRGQGGFLVPADGDTAHAFVPPDPTTDIRGPCPGLNVAANHNFLPHDGVVTYNELLDAQQNLYNVGYDLANLLALLGLTLTDGDVATERLSLGCDATSRTSVAPALTGSEPGLDGHNRFEADTSLTRNDYFTHDGDNYSFNGTLFAMMTETTGGNYDREGLALYRYQRYQQSVQENPNFYFGPIELLQFGAASFLYTLMPSGTRNYAADEDTISSFFGAEKQSDDTYTFNGMEKIPDNWTNRIHPYDIVGVIQEIRNMYDLHPVLFGGNTADGSFDTINFGAIRDGKLPVDLSVHDVQCLLYQLLTERVPTYLDGLVTPTVETLSLIESKLSRTSFANLGCPQALTK